MATSKDSLRKELDVLIRSTFSAPPKQFSEEELAVKQTIQQLIHLLSQPSEQRSTLSTVPIDSIENMTKLGQLTLVAESLDNDFLNSVKKIVSNSNAKFEKDGKEISLVDLYNKCRTALIKSQHKQPLFSDVLLRMYTVECPFYKKMNAILGGYNDPNTTTEEERVLSFLLNVALHKAGLEKRKLEVQSAPDELYRGQSFGFTLVEKKFKRVKELHDQGKLTTLTSAELAEVNIVDIAAKKALSTTDVVEVSEKFAGSKGIVLHVQNPEEIADYYNVAKISEIKKESEFMSRVPDDVAMIPIDIVKDSQDIYHIHVVCIRSESVLLQSSTRFNTLRDSLKDYIDSTIKTYEHSKDRMFSKPILSQQQIFFFKDLRKLLQELENINNKSSPQDRMLFLTQTMVLLEDLYQSAKPEGKQKEVCDKLKSMLGEFFAVIAELNVVHTDHDMAKEIRKALNDIEANINGKKIWLKEISGTGIKPIKAELDIIIDPKTTHIQLKQAATQIINTLKTNTDLAKRFPMLEASMNDLIKNVDKITSNLAKMPSAQRHRQEEIIDQVYRYRTVQATKDMKSKLNTVKEDAVKLKQPADEENLTKKSI